MNEYEELLASVREMTTGGWAAWAAHTDVPMGSTDDRGYREADDLGLIEPDPRYRMTTWRLTERGTTLAATVLSIAQGPSGATASSIVAVERVEDLPPTKVRETLLDAARGLAAEGWLVTATPGVHEWFPYEPTLLCRVVAAWRESTLVLNLEQLIEGHRLSEAAIMLLRFGADVRALAVLDQELGSLIMSEPLREGMSHRLKQLREQAVTLHAILDFFCERSAKLIEQMDAHVDHNPTQKD